MSERSFIDSILAKVAAEVRADAERVGQMMLGVPIEALSEMDGTMPIVTDRFDHAPGEFTSYRGYYEQIAFEPSLATPSSGAIGLRKPFTLIVSGLPFFSTPIAPFS